MSKGRPMKKVRLMKVVGLAIAVAALSGARSATADDWTSHYVAAGVNADGKVTLEFKGKPGYFINTAYPTKLTLTAPDDVKLGKTKLGKKDGKAHGLKEGKADRLTFETTASKKAPIKVAYRIVVCNPESCSPPLKGELVTK